MAEEFTAKFKLDISDLKQNISEANKQIKLANATFKAQTAGMDKWSANADGLSAKLKQLKTVLEQQKTILSAYKKQMEEQEKAYAESGKKVEELQKKLQDLSRNGVEKTSDEYKGYEKALKEAQREQDSNAKAVDNLRLKILNQEAAVGETERSIRHYDGALEDLGKETESTAEAVETSSEGFTVFKGVLADLASTAIKAVVQGLKDLGQAAIDAYKDYDEGMDNIIKKTGASGDAARDLQKAYEGVAGSVVAYMSDIGNAVGEVNTRFGLTGQELEDLSVKFLKFAELNDTDVNSSIDSVQAAMAAFNMDASDAGDVLDIITKAAQNTGVPVDSLTSSLLSNATALQEMGLGINTSIGLLSGLEKSGVDTSSVMTGLKKALQNAAKDGKPLDEALADIQKSMEGAESDTAAMQAAMELFGNKAGPAIAKAVQEGRLSFDELSNTVTDWGDAVDGTYESILDGGDHVELAMQNLRTAVGSTMSEFIDEHAPQIQALMEDFTTNLLPGLMEVFGALLEGLGWLADHGADVAAVIGSIAAGVAAYVGYQTALILMTKGWEGLTIATKAAAVGQKLLNAAMSANPIGLVIAAVTALVAAFIYFWNTSEDFRNFWIGLWEAIKAAVQPVIEYLVGAFTSAWENIKEVWSGVSAFFSGKWKQIKSVFNGVKSWFSDKFGAAWSAIKGKFSGWASFWGGLWGQIKSKFSSIGTSIAGAISGAVKGGINNLIGQMQSTINSAIGLINGAIDIINKVPGVNIGHVSTVSFPRLARGGVLARGQIGILEGDGAEAVVPLERNKYWIKKVAQDMVEDLRTEAGAAGLNAIAGRGGTNYTQIINAPKQPSRIQLYRQTRNLLAMKGGTA